MSDEHLAAMLVERGRVGRAASDRARRAAAAADEAGTTRLGPAAATPTTRAESNCADRRGPVEAKVPRDTSGTFDPHIVEKRQGRRGDQVLVELPGEEAGRLGEEGEGATTGVGEMVL
ncbi:hypothetical protein ACFV46_12730 [Streptomyces sp. NPDC059852]|uniref:hypothetical protein n=1 Tax=Streptomyces sp. NPDC059852 TaxID=3346972 RepID=UPI00364F99B3